MSFTIDVLLSSTILVVSIYYFINKIIFSKYKNPILISIDGNIGSGKST